MATSKKNKKIALIAVAVCLVIIGAGFFIYQQNTAVSSDGSVAFKTVTPKQAIELIKTKPNLLIVDIRSPHELREGWIEGSTFMPVQDIVNGTKRPPKDRPVLLVCAVGGRSLGIGQAMASYGWPEIYNLQGGISEWKRQGLPLKYQ